MFSTLKNVRNQNRVLILNYNELGRRKSIKLGNSILARRCSNCARIRLNVYFNRYVGELRVIECFALLLVRSAAEAPQINNLCSDLWRKIRFESIRT